MITPPLSISASPVLTRSVPVSVPTVPIVSLLAVLARSLLPARTRPVRDVWEPIARRAFHRDRRRTSCRRCGGRPRSGPPRRRVPDRLCRPMHILGINCFSHDTAAALLRDGVPVSFIEEERFNREKHTR